MPSESPMVTEKELKETEKVLKEAQKELKETMLDEFKTHKKEIQDALTLGISRLEEPLKKVYMRGQNSHQKNLDDWGKTILGEVQVMAHEIRSMPSAVKSFDGRLESSWSDVEGKMVALKNHIVRLDEEVGSKVGKIVHQMHLYTDPFTQTAEISREMSSRSSKMSQVMDEISVHVNNMSQSQRKIKSLEDTYQKDLLQSLLDLQGAQDNCKKSLEGITERNKNFADEIAKKNEKIAEQAQDLINSKQKEIVKSLSAAATNCEEIAGNARDEMNKLRNVIQTSVATTIDKLNSVQSNVSEKVNALAEKSSQHTSRLEQKADDAVKELDVRSKQIGASLDRGFADANRKLLDLVEEYRNKVHPEVERTTNALHNLVHSDEMKRAKNDLRDSVSHCKEEIDKTKKDLRDSVSHCKEEIDKLKPDKEALQEIRTLANGLTQTINSVQPLLNQVRGGGALGFVATLGAVIPLLFR